MSLEDSYDENQGRVVVIKGVPMPSFRFLSHPPFAAQQERGKRHCLHRRILATNRNTTLHIRLCCKGSHDSAGVLTPLELPSLTPFPGASSSPLPRTLEGLRLRPACRPWEMYSSKEAFHSGCQRERAGRPRTGSDADQAMRRRSSSSVTWSSGQTMYCRGKIEHG